VAVETQDVETKMIAIVRTLSQCRQPVGVRVISYLFREQSIELTERMDRYQLKLVEERRFTETVARDGRLITELGREKSGDPLASDKVGFVASEIELLTCETDFDRNKRQLRVLLGLSLFPGQRFRKVLEVMSKAFRVGLCASQLVVVGGEGENLGAVAARHGKIGLATICSTIVNGALPKAGVPTNTKFGEILWVRNRKPLRLAGLIQYSGSSSDSSETFMTSRMAKCRQGCQGRTGKDTG